MNRSKFQPKNHITNLISDDYYKNLTALRSKIGIVCDDYFQNLNAPRVDLFLISHSVSSPIALGSDSEPVKFNLNSKDYFLSDSSQFGMEPLLIKSFDMVYCYLPSFRGEDPDARHLNQFFHCEAELKGDYKLAMNIAEGLVKHLIKAVLSGLKKEFEFEGRIKIEVFENTVQSKFPRISFDEAVKLLEKHGPGKLIEKKPFGRILTNDGEKEIVSLVSDNKLPVWVTNYDRDTVAFYQAPDPTNDSKVLNADLLVPPMTNDAFSGEILGLGQRQNKVKNIVESMKRQKIKNSGQYDWYIDLRNNPHYKTTSGFGLGIERFIAWILGLNNLADACIYPVLKDVETPY